jgi:hypothetical protein
LACRIIRAYAGRTHYAVVGENPAGEYSVERARRVGSVTPAARDSAGAVIRDVVFV